MNSAIRSVSLLLVFQLMLLICVNSVAGQQQPPNPSVDTPLPAASDPIPSADNSSNAESASNSETLPLAPQLEIKEEQKVAYTQTGRDPFVSLVEPSPDDSVIETTKGLPSMMIAELALQGIQIGLGKVAMFKGPDNNVYAMRVDDSCKDGKMVDIQNNKVMFEKLVLDEFGREKEKQQIEVYLHR